MQIFLFVVGVPSLIVGLTVVAFGTCAPEFAVSVKSALTCQASIAVGNVVGSNVFNVLFILGLSGLICPLFFSKQLIRFDVPLMIGASILVFLLAWDHRLTRLDGLLLFGGLILYTTFLIYLSRKHSNHEKSSQVLTQHLNKRSVMINVVFIFAGLLLLVIGSRFLFNNAVAFAQVLGVSELVIGLTIVAAGHSLPVFFTGGIISQWEGGFLFAYYFAYTASLILVVTRHEALPMFHAAMMYFVIPLTVVTLTVTAALGRFAENMTSARWQRPNNADVSLQRKTQ